MRLRMIRPVFWEGGLAATFRVFSGSNLTTALYLLSMLLRAHEVSFTFRMVAAQVLRDSRRGDRHYRGCAGACFVPLLAPFPAHPHGGYTMKRLRQIREEEIISQFLMAEYYQQEFDKDRCQLEQIVHDP